MNNKIKIIFTDLDNTLLKTDKSISNYSIDIINKCKTQGILFGIATARSEREAHPYIKMINPEIIISNGGAIVRFKDKIIYESMISKEITNSLLNDCIQCKFISDITLETRDSYYWNYKDKSSLSNEYMHAVYNDFKNPLNQPTYKFTVKVSSVDSAIKIVEKYNQLNMLLFSNEAWVRFANKHAAKECAIDAISKYLKIGRNHIAAFGDDYNDIKMIKYCNVGVTVDNAIDEVKKAANHICGSNDDDGVADFIEKFVL